MAKRSTTPDPDAIAKLPKLRDMPRAEIERRRNHAAEGRTEVHRVAAGLPPEGDRTALTRRPETLETLLPLARLETTIEQMIARHGVFEVLDALMRVCNSRGMHPLARKLDTVRKSIESDQ